MSEGEEVAEFAGGSGQKEGAVRSDVRGPRGDSYLRCNNVDARTVKCLLRECKEVGAEPPRPKCERFRRHRDGEWLLIDACRTQAPGASPGVDDVTAMKAA